MVHLLQIFLCLFSFFTLVFFILFLRQIIQLPGYKKVDSFPFFVASLLVILLSTFWAIPVKNKDAWTAPIKHNDRCADLTGSSINFITYHNNSLFVASTNSTSGPSQIVSYSPDLSRQQKTFPFSGVVRCLTVGDHVYAADQFAPRAIYNIDTNSTFATLAFEPQSIAVSHDLLYASGENISYVAELRLDTAEESRFQTFGPGPLNTFSDPKGILFLNGLLYVCDRSSVYVFKNRQLVQTYGPILNPLYVAVWKKQLVITTRFFIFFYDLESTNYLGAIKQIKAKRIAASHSTLYIVDDANSLCGYS